MRKTTKSVQRPNPKYRTTFDSAMHRIIRMYVNAKAELVTLATALRAVGSGNIVIIRK